MKADVVWLVTRVLRRPFRWNPALDRIDQNQVATYTEGGAQRRLDAGEWLQHPTDGAIAEIVGEHADQGQANEDMMRKASDYPMREYRVSASVAPRGCRRG